MIRIYEILFTLIMSLSSIILHASGSSVPGHSTAAAAADAAVFIAQVITFSLLSGDSEVYFLLFCFTADPLPSGYPNLEHRNAASKYLRHRQNPAQLLQERLLYMYLQHLSKPIRFSRRYKVR